MTRRTERLNDQLRPRRTRRPGGTNRGNLLPSRQRSPMVNPRIVAAVVLTGALVLAACGKDGDEPQPSPSLAVTSAPNTLTPLHTGLTRYNANNPLRVDGRDNMRACVQALDDSIDLKAAATAIEEALLSASTDKRWPAAWGVPAVDEGCPLPPVALDEARGTLRTLCLAEVSPYLVFVFIGDTTQFAERFHEKTVRESNGVRKATEEELLAQEDCLGQVSEAWYITPAELGDPTLLQRFIFGPLGIFPIAQFRP